jgi:hypothetical protein
VQNIFLEIAKLILHKVETGVTSPYNFKSKNGKDYFNSPKEGVGLQRKKGGSEVNNTSKVCC